MKNVFVDTDVLIDFLIDREPFATEAAKILTYAEKGLVNCHISSMCFSNIFYITRKVHGKKEALALIKRLETVVETLTVDKNTIRQALVSNFSDFEDAIQNYCAKQEGLGIIITRNIKDFSKSELSIYTPESYLKAIEKNLK
ncbi:MAG: PIN domain-containing protein [Bacteroidota bacterium]